jgi:hypothetical protein
MVMSTIWLIVFAALFLLLMGALVGSELDTESRRRRHREMAGQRREATDERRRELRQRTRL